MPKTILVTGGAGFIGSHTCVDLLQNGYDVIIADNLVNSKRGVLAHIERVAGRTLTFNQVDVTDETALSKIFEAHEIDAVIHFAGLKAVGESVAQPLRYYRNNLNATLTLLACMEKYGVHKLAFSSSATVYAITPSPIAEDAPLGGCTNPYGWTKFMSEQIIADWARCDERRSAVLLRYFNPIGAHESGLLGEDPQGIPNNLFPYVARVAAGQYPHLSVFGDDYNTHDGTGVRDYIHVMDLARGHVCALNYLDTHTGCIPINLGRGEGYSVLDLVHAYESATGKPVPYRIGPRRPGDVDATYADPTRARELLHWTAERDLANMCACGNRWQMQYPNGYEG
ncbi:MAG: UDP-glucose 4-epimerase GalE [Clostridiales bacterium]|nr:UDP-glucose 4-epimerase GalE [Clostridiales bacterium]